jgi:2'-5' RNA ligase
MEKIRTFIALEMPSPIRKALAGISSQLKLDLSGLPLRWVPVENMHLTLKFLGDISPDQIAGITKTLESLTANLAPMEISVDGIGAFPNRQRARVIWVGLAVPESLHQLQRNIEGRLAELGFPGENRAFLPHLTLVRVRGHARPMDLRKIGAVLASSASLPFTSSTAEKITFFRSELKPSGSVYNALSQFVLSNKS